MKRSMAVIGITWLLSQIIAIAAGTAMSAVLCAATVLFAVSSFKLLSDRHRRVILPVLVVCSIAFGMFSGYSIVKVEPAQRLYGQTIDISGEIAEPPYSSNGRYYYIVDTDMIRSTEELQKTRIRISSKIPLEADVTDRINCTVTILVPEDDEGFGTVAHRIARGIMLTAYIPYNCEPIITDGSHGLKFVLNQIRTAIYSHIDRLFDGDIAGLMKGILLGDDSCISSGLVSDFRICGLSHILAVSGLHMSILVAVFTRLLRNLGVAHRPLAAILLAIIIVYMALTGFSYSVFRAGIMTGLMLTARIVNRENDSLNSFGTALTILCFSSPFAAADAGLLLSAASSFGLIAFYDKIYGRAEKYICRHISDPFGLVKSMTATAVTSLVSSAFAMPILMLYFGELSLISPVANLLCVQLSTLFMVSGGLAVILSFLPFVGAVLSRLVAVVSWCSGKLMKFIVEMLAKLPNASVFVNYDFLPFFFLSSAILLLFCYFISKEHADRFRSICKCLAVIVLVFLLSVLFENIVTLNDNYFTVYNVEDGIAVLAVSGNDSVMVGTGGDRYAAWQMTADLQDKNLSQIDALIYPNAHDEYASYADGFLETVTVGRIYMPSLSEASDELAYAVRNYSDRLKELSSDSYISRNGKLAATVYTDAQGEIWTFIRNDNITLLICPENGDCSLLPDEMRSPWCAVVQSAEITNLGILSPFSVVISADAKQCANAEAVIRYRGVENVYTTAQGNVVISKDGAGMRIGGK